MEVNGEKPIPNTVTWPSDEQAYWTSRRQEIHAWLQEQSSSLAELYQGAVSLMFEPQVIPGRVKFISHAVREIRNRLPNETSSYLRYSEEIDQLISYWKNHDLPLEEIEITISGGYTQQPTSLPDIVIPRAVFLQIQTILQKHLSVPRTNRKKSEKFFQQCIPEAEEKIEVLVKQWWKTTEWFMNQTHDNGRLDADCNEHELKSRFSEFESFLGTLSQSFYSNTDELDKILEETNT